MAVWEKPHCLSVWEWPRYSDLKAYVQHHQRGQACKAYSKALEIRLGSILREKTLLKNRDVQISMISSAPCGYFSMPGLKRAQGSKYTWCTVTLFL